MITYKTEQEASTAGVAAVSAAVNLVGKLTTFRVLPISEGFKVMVVPVGKGLPFYL